MQQRGWLKFIYTVSFLVTLNFKPAHAQSLSFSRNSRTFETQQSSLVVKGLAHACLASSSIPDSIPCNPANTSLVKNKSLGVNLMLSNGYETLKSARDLLSGEITQSTIDSLFQENQTLQLELNSEINLLSRALNVRLVPQTIKYFSTVRNEANPEVEVNTVSESSLTMQSGLEAFDNIYIGGQIRTLTRKFIRKQVFLVDLATQAGKDSLKPKQEDLIFLEPGMTWTPDFFWQPKLSLFVANIPLGSGPSEDLPTPIEPQFGLSVSPNIGFGDLELNFDIRSMNYDESFSEQLRFGALYGFGGMHLFGGVDTNGISGGLYYKVEEFHAGILYSTTEFPNQNEDFYTQTIYTQFGWQN